ncbi:hTAFII28-like protein conserved region-domain-containing protein [Paraphoma chrysanthemicola]|uniref:HTAFII28-like protein conserved region-domain-containing protein n=1 Tax=Paraphoma chrysanthemicola TaxID=798071 RepID=A0A8K0R2C0_9PLEO|nr:hTAFII28-like protein conserved region-domain-containing protein [Paraphoma chrysanthemicola]
MASPPHMPSLNVPRKRGSISSLNGAPAKKRKPSHLRNAYSPESEGPGSPRFSRSPSVDSVATTSVINGAGGKKRRKKGDGDAASVVSSARGGRGGKGADAGSLVGGEGADGAEYEEEDDDDMGEEMGMAVEEGGMTAEERRREEQKHERMLLEFMSPLQQERHENYRRIRLKRETVRKLVNQTLSQSVPQPVIIAVTTYAKSFIGSIIDRALTVRDEWAVASTHLPNGALPPAVLMQSLQRPSAHIKDDRNKPTNADIQQAGLYINQVNRDESIWTEIAEDASLQERLKQSTLGPLTPAHLREALRRYKRDRDGGGAGFAGMSLEGVERTMSRTGGKRLFR